MGEKRRLSRRKFVKRAALGGLGLAGGGLAYSLLRKTPGPAYPPEYLGAVSPLADFVGDRPNIILINADDLGYGDLSCYGSQAINTPNIDRLAQEGVRFTDFHTCDAVCTPSRAGLLTGRYPVRMMLDTPLHPGNQPLRKRAVVRLGYLAGKIGLIDLATRDATAGIHVAEITIAEALGSAGYRTGMVGKWHLGDYTHDPSFNPIRHGFDSYFGVPYSNDMDPFPLYRNEEVLEADVQAQGALTGLYTNEAINFIESPQEEPFFLYLAHTFPHRPLFASDGFAGNSAGGLYGDVVQEIDWSVGRILETLEENGLAENTLVFFTSDNGPWYQGSPGPFRGRKGQAFEGGHRVPFVARAPHLIPPGMVCDAPAINLDLFPTCLAAAGLALPGDRVIDGLDITSLLRGESSLSPHEYFYLYHQGELEGIRSGDWKYFRNTSHYTWPMPNNKKLGSIANHTTGPLPLLHNLSTDPGEAYNLAERFPEMVTSLDAAMTEWEAEVTSNPLGFFR
ncbi:MAG: sulfatase [Gemmatimonadota bacterium]